MSSAGQQLVADRIPGERINTTERNSASSGFTTTETVLDSVTASLVAGRTYKVRAVEPIQSTVADDLVRFRLRQDNVSGSQLWLDNFSLPVGSVNFMHGMEAEFTATATADKTFVATAVRQTGTGTLTSGASSAQKALLYVDFISG